METVLQVNQLKTHFQTEEGLVKAVDGINFELRKGEVLGLVGESGSGKSVTALSIMRLFSQGKGIITSGDVSFGGRNILQLSEAEIRHIRGAKISMIFQDPMTSLNPFLRVSTQLIETIRLHQQISKTDAIKKSIDLLHMVGIPEPERRIYDYPHQFSGGMRQRIVIAIALSCSPEILIADEPTTALDVTIQAQILELIKDLVERLGTSVILITHDLGIVAGMCHRVHVMYAGKIVEKSSVDDIFAEPRHPYSRGLLLSLPRIDDEKDQLYSIPGQPPGLIDLPNCCPFSERCEYVEDICRQQYPPQTELGVDRSVSCWRYTKEDV